MSYLVTLYVSKIKDGDISLEDVPAGLKTAVEDALNETEENENVY